MGTGGLQKEIPEVRIFRSIFVGILTDESFTIETKVCLEADRALVNLYGEPSLDCIEFSCWLVDVQDIIEKSKNTMVYLTKTNFGVDFMKPLLPISLK